MNVKPSHVLGLLAIWFSNIHLLCPLPPLPFLQGGTCCWLELMGPKYHARKSWWSTWATVSTTSPTSSRRRASTSWWSNGATSTSQEARTTSLSKNHLSQDPRPSRAGGPAKDSYSLNYTHTLNILLDLLLHIFCVFNPFHSICFIQIITFPTILHVS